MTDTVYLNATEAADYCRMSRHYVLDAAQAGELAGIKSSPGGGGRWVFTKTDIDRWMETKRRAARRPLRSTG